MSSDYSIFGYPLGQKYFTFVLLLSVVLSAEFCEVEGRGQTSCGKALDDMLCIICKNGFNIKDLDDSLHRLRSRRQADIFPLPQIFTDQFPTIGKRRPSLKKVLRREARRRRKHQITGRRLRRQSQPLVRGVADECCRNGCTYADIAAYCRNIFDGDI